MKFHAIMTGMGIKPHTAKAIHSLFGFNLNMIITWVECADEIGLTTDLLYPNFRHLHRPGYSFTQAMNHSLNHSGIDADWILLLDDDVVCTGAFDFSFQDPMAIYGPTLITDRGEFPGMEWLEGWALAVSGAAVKAGLRFDEGIIASGFEDLDLCMTAKSMALGMEHRPDLFPLDHLAAGSKFDITENYTDARLQNIKYVQEKWL